MNVFIYVLLGFLIDILICLYVCLCIYVFMCGCIYVFMENHKRGFVLYGIVVLWISVNPFSSLSIPFVINRYVYMLLFARSLRADRQNAILRLQSRLYHCTMGYKRIETA